MEKKSEGTVPQSKSSMLQTDQNIVHKLLAAGRPDAVAIMQKDECISYGELKGKINDYAAFLFRLGLKKGDRIGLFSENSAFFVISYLAVILTGCCVVPIQTTISENRLKETIDNCGISVLMVSEKFRGKLASWLNRAKVKQYNEAVLSKSHTCAKPPSFYAIDNPKEDLACISFTSGSSGQSKGVMVSHKNIDCNTNDIIAYSGLTRHDRVMVVLPFYYCFGASLLHTHLMVGATLVINNNFMFPEKVLDEMTEKRCTGFAGVPSHYQILIRKSTFLKRDFTHLKWFKQAGGRLPDSYIKEICLAFPGKRFYLMYGQTEGTSRLSYLPPELLDQKMGSIGKGLPSTNLSVLKACGSPVERGSDEIGEIVASGENVTTGYWEDAEETRKYFRDGKLYTGDLARVDHDGFIFIVGRDRDFIKSAGHRVSAGEVENTIAAMKEIVEAAVVGVPHEIKGEAIKIFVVLAPGAAFDRDKLFSYCKRHLPSHKIPEYVECLPFLPKKSNGKIDKAKLSPEGLTT